MALVPCPGCARLVRSVETACPFCNARGVSSAAIFALGLAVAGCHKTPATTGGDAGGLSSLGSAGPVSMMGAYGGPPVAPADAADPSLHGDVTLGITADAGSDVRMLLGARPGLRACYNRGLMGDPSMAGTASFRLEVSATGKPQATTTSNAGLSSDVETCMLHKLGRLELDAAPAHTIEVQVVAKKQTP
jgi:hypothetical protein